MGDRRQSFSFRFWPARRTPTPAPANSATRRTGESQPAPPTFTVATTKPTSTNPPPVENQISSQPPTTANSGPITKVTPESQPVTRQSGDGTTSPASTAPPPAETPIPSQPPSTTNYTPFIEPKSVSRPSTTGTTNSTSVTPPTARTQTPPSPATTKLTPTTTPTAESQAASRQSTTNTTNPTTTPPPTAETQTPGNQFTTTSNSPSNPTSPSTIKKNDSQPRTTTLGPIAPLPSEMRTTSPPTTTTLTSHTNEPKTSSSTSPIKSPLSSKPLSPSRLTPKSPPQPPSPAHVAPQARSITSSSPSHNSKTSSTTQRASQTHSPSHLTSPSPKQTSLNSPKDKHPYPPSNETRQVAKDTSIVYEVPPLASNEKKSMPEASQKEPEVKSKCSNDFDGEDDTSFKHNDVKEMPSKSSQLGDIIAAAPNPEISTPAKKIDASTIYGGHAPLIEFKSKPEETKDVKEVVQATKIKANEVKKLEVNDFSSPNSGFEEHIVKKSGIPSKSDEKGIEKQEELARKEILANSLPIAKPTNTIISQPKRSATPSTHDHSTRSSGEHLSLNKDIKDDISAFINQMPIGDPKNVIHDRKMSIITLAGENRGASMQMGSNSFREGPVHIQRGYKVNPDESAETITDGEQSFRGKRSEDAKVAEDQPTEAYVNNNAQGINNSIVFNASIAERDPGVHMVVTHVPKEPIQPVEKMSPLETRKAEFNVSHAKKCTYEPTIRRRCLRGLLMETSDSDPENTEKPRRHGCRVGCKLKEKENDIDVV